MFHVGLLKKCMGQSPATIHDLPPTAEDDTILPQPKAVLQRRIIRKGRYRPKTEILVKWHRTLAKDAT